MDQFVDAAKTFMTDVLFKSIPKLIVAILVFWIGWKLIKLLHRVLLKAYKRHTVDPSLQQFLNSLIDVTLKILLALTAMAQPQKSSFKGDKRKNSASSKTSG